MNLEDYERIYRPLYGDLAATVRHVLEHAIREAGLPRPQSIQDRAKTAASLKARLEGEGLLNSQEVEQVRRDLAGVRLIFYTNNDVDAFLRSRLVLDNFEIEKGATKVHHPMPENDRVRYRAIHYTVRLKEERSKLPEYARFVGLRCEIQIQTILNHAWSETTHDILYKADRPDGFGAAAMARLNTRINDIMDKYLLPAGYEFQRVQHDYQRLKQGKSLFDRNAIAILTGAKDNNERHEILTALKDDILPNYYDPPEIYHDLIGPLLEAAGAARTSSPVPITTPFGEFPGHTAEDIVRVIVEIFEYMRFVDLRATLRALMTIYRDESDEEVRKKIVEVARRLSKYNLSVWRKVGPAVQRELVDYLAEQPASELDAAFGIPLTVWGEALRSDLTGTTWHADSVTFSSGAVGASEALKEIRVRAIEALFAAFDRAQSENTKVEILGALDAATHLPTQAEYSNELLALSLSDAARIVEFVIVRSGPLSYELKQDLECRFHLDYERAVELATDEADRFQCKDKAAALAAAIVRFRDLINQDEAFVRYKVLVGFRSIFAGHWADGGLDYQRAEKYRQRQADRYIAEITVETRDDWLKFLERCATTESKDLATFPTFSRFLVTLSRTKPDIAEYFATNGNGALLGFLAAFLGGLFESASPDIYHRVLDREIVSGGHLWALVRHWRNAKPTAPEKIVRILNLAIEQNEPMAVGECLIFALENAGTELVPPVESFYRRALRYLTEIGDTKWINMAWYLPTISAAFRVLSEDDARILLNNMENAPRIGSHEERLLTYVAERYLRAVWDFFGVRLTHERTKGNDARFEAVPFSFHDLEKPLSADPKLAIAMGRAWHSQDRDLFQFRGGRLLSAAFPHCTDAFADELSQLVSAGVVEDAKFALSILQNYHGEPTAQAVLKAIVSCHVGDERTLDGVRAAFDNTGGVWGQYGMADALRNKKQAMVEWLADERDQVRAFAEQHIRELELQIAAEQRRAEDDAEIRRHRSGDDDDGENVE